MRSVLRQDGLGSELQFPFIKGMGDRIRCRPGGPDLEDVLHWNPAVADERGAAGDGIGFELRDLQAKAGTAGELQPVGGAIIRGIRRFYGLGLRACVVRFLLLGFLQPDGCGHPVTRDLKGFEATSEGQMGRGGGDQLAPEQVAIGGDEHLLRRVLLAEARHEQRLTTGHGVHGRNPGFAGVRADREVADNHSPCAVAPKISRLKNKPQTRALLRRCGNLQHGRVVQVDLDLLGAKLKAARNFAGCLHLTAALHLAFRSLQSGIER